MKLYASLFLSLFADGATPKNLRGSNPTDTQPVRKLSDMAIAMYKRDKSQQDSIPTWADCSRMKQITVSDNAKKVWGVIKKEGDNVCGPWDEERNIGIINHFDSRLKQISISGNGNHVWGVNSNDEIYFLYTDWDQGKEYFKRLQNGLLKQVSVTNNGDVWGVNKNDNIYFKSANDDGWTQIGNDTTMLKQISVSSNGEHVWGVNSDNLIYFWDGGRFLQFPHGTLKQVEVTDDGDVWGVNKNDKIYFKSANDDGWTHVGTDTTMLDYISVSGDGKQVWGVNDDGAIYQWNGSFGNRPFNQKIMYGN